MFIESNNGQGPQDIYSVMTELNAVNEGFQTRQVELNETVANWRASLSQNLDDAAQRLEKRLPFIQDGTVFRGLRMDQHGKAIDDLLSTFQNQREFVAPLLADFPDVSASRLMIVLNQLIPCLQKQKKEQEAHRRNVMRFDPKRGAPDSNSSRRTVAKQMGRIIYPDDKDGTPVN